MSGVLILNLTHLIETVTANDDDEEEEEEEDIDRSKKDSLNDSHKESKNNN